MHIHNSPNCHDVIYGQKFIVIHHLQVNIVNTECKRFYFGCCYQSPPYLIVLYIHVYCRCFEYTTIVLAASGISFLEFNATFGKMNDWLTSHKKEKAEPLQMTWQWECKIIKY